MRSVNSGVRPSWAADELHGLLGPVTWELWEPRGCTGEGGDMGGSHTGYS